MPSSPVRLRNRLRLAAESLARRASTGQLANSSQPLTGRVLGPPSAADLLAIDDLGTAAASPQERNSGRARSLPPDVPRCLLVTTQLDFGGLAEVVRLLALELPGHGVRTVCSGYASLI